LLISSFIVVYKIKARSIFVKFRTLIRDKDFHYKIDFAIPEDEKIMSTAKGVITEAKFDKEKGWGNNIIIKHNNVFTTFYSHLKSVSVKEGDQIEKGQIIGYIGNTSKSTGPHLHYEVFKNGEHVNPAD
jgi:murein DD-endopeptidase MepM/ murein hydrolase activator NlpD